ncbi:hypothetical protein C4S76_09350 [Apibacter adventoris]|nr:hypothetical protein C4S76_09350 [Apibacter adventoris]
MKKIALFSNHIKLVAKMVNFAGFEMPIQYSGINNEHLAVRGYSQINTDIFIEVRDKKLKYKITKLPFI